MRIGEVYTKRACLEAVYDKDSVGENVLIDLPEGSVVDKIRTVVEEAFDGTAKIEYQVGGTGGEYGAAIDLTSVGVTDRQGKGMLSAGQEIVAKITGTPTTGGVRVLVDFWFPTKEEKGI